MRSLSFLATLYAAARIGTSSALVDARERTTVGVETPPVYDERTSGNGCGPGGCIPPVPHETRDQNRRTRWSCKGALLYNDDGCWIAYSFEEPQDLVEMKIAYYKGTEDTRTLKVYVDGHYHSKITSSGNTNGYQTFHLDTDETEELKLILDDDEHVWISITEVDLMVM